MFEPGTQVGRYEIQRKLGRGGMGTVYVAHDPVLGRMVAIKVFAGDLDLPDARERFSREARAAAALSHPNIVTVHDYGEFELQPFIVMEYVAGETVASLIRRKAPILLADKLRWLEELCSGAGYAHRMQLVHRDLKPANLIIDRSSHLKILDFGIARILGLTSTTSLTIGTPGYMSPEQIRGDPLDDRADQFAIGVVSYELLAYTEAFPGDAIPIITLRVLEEDPVPLRQLVPDAPSRLVEIVNRALEKDPSERFADTEALREAIASVRLEASNRAWNVSRGAVDREPPSPPAGSRGTGSIRRRQDEAVGVATPPPDPNKSARAALTRRRATQLEAALNKARTLLAQGEFGLAFEACQQALTFDENDAAALRLEQEIESARHRRAKPAPDGAPHAIGEVPWSDQAAHPSSAQLEGGAFDVSPALPGADDSVPPMTPRDPVISVSSRKTPVYQPAGVAPAIDLPADDDSVERKTEIEPVLTDVVARRKTLIQTVRSMAPSAPRRRTVMTVVAVSVATAVAAVIVSKMLTAPVPTGTLVLDASPWGSIVAIQKENGESVAVPPSPFTPLSVTLPPGTYRLIIAGPPDETQPQQITVRIESGASTMPPLVRFRALTPEQYFEEYLSSAAPTPDSGVSPGAPATSAQSPPRAPSNPAGTP